MNNPATQTAILPGEVSGSQWRPVGRWWEDRDVRAREFKQARARLGLSQTGLADALGLHRSAVARYEIGTLPVPKVVALAVEALERRAAEGSK